MKKLIPHLLQLKNDEHLTSFEIEMAKFFKRRDSTFTENGLKAIVLAIHDELNGNICVDLSELEQHSLYKHLDFQFDSIKALTQELEGIQSIGGVGEQTPFILEGNRLYIQKYWCYEVELVEWLLNKMKDIPKEQPVPIKVGEELDFQKVAIALSLSTNLLIISGGPGTGKTYTVKNILKQLLHIDNDMKIALTAPTGKAAERLSESIEELSDDIESMTVHRLLGANRKGEFRFNEDHQLPYDVVVVDEASMLDLKMWIHLVRAIKKGTKLIVLGDKDQLSSVEAGSILGDICYKADTGFSETILNNELSSFVNLPKNDTNNLLNDHIVLLTKFYRASEHSGINELATAINNQRLSEVKPLMSTLPSIEHQEPSKGKIETLLANYVDEIIRGDMNTQILCSNRSGRLGVDAINAWVENSMKQRYGLPVHREWYKGQRIIITRNDTSIGVRNGEVGTCFVHQSGEYYLRFGPDKEIPITRLKDYKPAYAITIHKSQGSEYNSVIIMLSDYINPVLTKELLYTGVTRARQNLLVISSNEVLDYCIENSIKRSSGLREKLLS